jgi:Tol biopolymer transport system component
MLGRGLFAVSIAVLGVALAAVPAGSGTFPGANGLIAFTSGSDVKVVNADGTGLDTIANGLFPSWSADGSKIAYERSGDIYMANADGSGEEQLTSGPALDEEPSWSPDGSAIAFMREESGERDVAVVVVATKVATEIITGDFIASHPAWSPDGTKIAYRSSQVGCGGSRCIYLANPDGSGQTSLVNTNDFRAAGQPSWSPDGSKVVFTYDDDPDAVNFSGGIGVIASSGGTPTAITNDPATDDEDPVFSPDGTKLAYSRDGSLIVANADGSNAHAVAGVTIAGELGSSWAVAMSDSPETPDVPIDQVASPIAVTPNFTG